MFEENADFKDFRRKQLSARTTPSELEHEALGTPSLSLT